MYSVSRETFKNSTITFGSIFNGEKFNANDIHESEERLDNREMIIKDREKSGLFTTEYLDKLHKTLISFFDKFNLLTIHYKACHAIDEWYNEGMDSTEMSAWKDIFCGGESLYYVFKDSNINATKKESLARFLKAIKSIEDKFQEERTKLLPGLDKKEVKLAFESVNTKAFQIGVFMALDIFRADESFDETYESFFSKMNTLSEKDWVYVLTTFRGRLMPRGATPKLWPVYQKLILRLIQDAEHPYYSQDNFSASPDGKIFHESIETSFDAWYETNDTIDEETMSLQTVKGQMETWANKAKQEVEELFKPLGKSIIQAQYEKEAASIVEQLIKEVKGK